MYDSPGLPLDEREKLKKQTDELEEKLEKLKSDVKDENSRYDIPLCS